MTAVLSSVITLALAYLIWALAARRRLERRIAELESHLDRQLEEFRERLGETIRERVRQGVLDGVASIPTAKLLRGAGRTVTDSAGELIRGGLDAILGRPGDQDES